MKLSRIIKPHIKKCWAKGHEHEWSGIIKREYWGNFAAADSKKVGGHGTHHLWYVISCNNTKCNGEKVVHSSVLANAL